MSFLRPATVAAAITLVAAATVPAPASATDLGVGFGAYAMTDDDPLWATTFTFLTPDFTVGASFSLRSGEGDTNFLLAAKMLATVKQVGTTNFGLGGTFAFVKDGSFRNDAYGLGFGGGLEKRLGDNIALVADLWPISFRFGGGTRFGLLTSGAVGVTWYFPEG